MAVASQARRYCHGLERTGLLQDNATGPGPLARDDIK
jgi:hypothetical protein